MVLGRPPLTLALIRANRRIVVNSIVWYDEWLTTGNRELLDRIVQYNEDDVRATYHVKKWLAQL